MQPAVVLAQETNDVRGSERERMRQKHKLGRYNRDKNEQLWLLHHIVQMTSQDKVIQWNCQIVDCKLKTFLTSQLKLKPFYTLPMKN